MDKNKKSRIVIELDKNIKQRLDIGLKDGGVSLTEWFNEKVLELYPKNIVENKEEEGLVVQDINDEKQVLNFFKKNDWSFTKENTTYLSHNIHPYPAKFIPQIPRNIIKALTVRGERVWDPFGGSGTTALEALILGRRMISSDSNPIATLVAQAKTLVITVDEERLISNIVEKFSIMSSSKDTLDKVYKKHKPTNDLIISTIPNIDKWFHKNSITELAILKKFIDSIKNDNVRTLATATFSKIITQASFQDGETRYASKPREVARGSIIKNFINHLELNKNKIKTNSTLLKFHNAEFRTADARFDDIVKPNSIDLVVTSPPYANSTDYHLYHRFRLFWLGYKPKEIGKIEIGSHLKHQRTGIGMDGYLLDMEICFKKIFQGLRCGRYAVLVLGNSVFKGKEYQTAKLLSQVANKIGFIVVGSTSRKLPTTKRSFIPAARRLKEEEILILKKPSKKIYFSLFPPPYKLWPHENKIRDLEIETLLNIKKRGKKGPILISNDKINKIKSLAFTHSFEAKNYNKELTWQAILENGEAFSVKSNRKDPKYVTHGIHAYKGKFYPQLAKSLINLSNTPLNGVILDPFCGSGTVLLESYLNGYESYGLDMNPLAVKIAKAKLEVLKVDPYLANKLITRFISRLDKINDKASNKNIFTKEILPELESWFPKPVLNKLGWIMSEAQQIPETAVRDFIIVCISSIVRDISQQEPRDLRIRRREKPIKDAPVKELLLKHLTRQKNKLQDFWSRNHNSPVKFKDGKVYKYDSRDWNSFVKSSLDSIKVDTVVTSPPYATALPYIDTDRLSILLLLGLKTKERAEIEGSLIGAREINSKERQLYENKIENRNFENITSRTAIKTVKQVYDLNKNATVGFRRKNMGSLLYRYYNDMTLSLNNINKIIKPGGSMFFVIGDNKTIAGGKEISLKSGKFILETAQNLGWETHRVIPITVTQENRLNNKNSITENQILWFKKK